MPEDRDHDDEVHYEYVVHHHFHHCWPWMPLAAGPEIDAMQVPLPPATCVEGTLQVVAPGDTLSAFARRFGVPLATIIAANPQLTDPNVLVPGQTICIPGTAGPGTPPIPPPCPQGRLYVVAPGETLTAIASRFGLTVPALIAANPRIHDPNLIFAGQQICLPIPPAPAPGPPPPPPCPNGNLVTVMGGDTLFAIAQRNGVTVQQIVAANPQLTNPNLIVPGQLLCVPTPF